WSDHQSARQRGNFHVKSRDSGHRISRALVMLAATSIIAAACGSDSKSSSTTAAAPAATQPAATTPVTTTPTATEPATTEAPATTSSAASLLDTNHDGKVQFGIAAAGPADDGAYYQAVVDAAKELSKANGFEDPIVVDKIEAADAATAIGDLAQQGVDVILVGASEIAQPLPDLIAKYPDIFWYCNCGAGFPPNPGLAQSTDDGGQINLAAGYATGLKLKEKGGDSVVFIGCCDLGFEKQAYLSFDVGLKLVDPSYTYTYVPSGDHQYDFDNTANATAALQTALDNGADAVYPYLGGALKPVVQAANEAGIITLSAGKSGLCENGEGLKYDVDVMFSGGDYVKAIMKLLIAGKFKEGDIKKFTVGIDPEPGAKICNATPDQQKAMDDIYAKIANGDFAAQLGEIAGKAFAPA
ncbi:MAG TPA: BMP family ABC transporter substrate-binding protein, partial [Ilumatobacteraceae bacterium]|nr:BMP family ABC transporter substrate-binding protein [Ilumatobacteraceae bacterium]